MEDQQTARREGYRQHKERQTDGLTILGRRVEHAIDADQLEVFPVSSSVKVIQFETNELSAYCPVTNQPDLYRLRLRYAPSGQALESKSLKLYLWGFQSRGVFAEALADELAGAIHAKLLAYWTEVELRQQRRGGLDLTVAARYEREQDLNITTYGEEG